jgi:hypothetical protein
MSAIDALSRIRGASTIGQRHIAAEHAADLVIA